MINNRKILSIILVLLLFTITPLQQVMAAEDKNGVERATGTFSTKDEVVYGNLATNGEIKHIYVVNSFDVDRPGKIIDYGAYTNVRNLTDLSEISTAPENEIHFQSKDETFFYQGELTDVELPWNISITYLLDGEEMAPEKIAGKSGTFEMRIGIEQNRKANPVFFEHYVMQISAIFDPLQFNNLQAPKGTEANEGKNKQIAFTVMPETEEVFIITADVTNLEMEPIQLSAVPANFAIDSPDTDEMTKDMEKLSEAIQEVNDGVAKLRDGIAELNEGTTDLAIGSTEFQKGLDELNDNSTELVNGSKEIRRALNQINNAMGSSSPTVNLGDLTKLASGLKEIAKNIRKIASGLDELRTNYTKAHHALKGAIQGIPSKTISSAELKKLQESNANKQVLSQLIETYEAAQRVKGTYSQTEAAFTAVTSTLSETTGPLYTMADELDKVAQGLYAGMEGLKELEGLGQLQAGLVELTKEYRTFHNGLEKYIDGVNSLAVNYKQFDDGIAQVSTGTEEVNRGVSDLHGGTSDLASSTKQMPDEMQAEIDEMLADYEHDNFEQVSFVDEENDNVHVVQFVLQTEKIEIETEEVGETEEKKESMWQRFLNLFRKSN